MRKAPPRRAWAAAFVFAVVTTTAYAQLVVTPQIAPTNGFIAPSTASKVVFSLRNTSTGTMDVVGFTPRMMLGALPTGCMGVSIGRLDNPGQQAATLGANQQQQYVATSTGFATAGQYDCTFDIMTNPAVVPGFEVTTTFHVSTTPSQGNVQPTVMSFGSQFAPAFEIQKLLVENFTGSATFADATITGDTANKFQFSGGCTGHSCMFGLGSSGAQVDIKCQASATDSATAMLDMYGSDSSYLGSMTLVCDAIGNSISVTPKPLEIMPSGMTIGYGSAMVSGTGNLSSASITSTDVSFKISDCNSTSCSFGSGLTLPHTLTIECQGQAIQTTGTLLVYDSGSGSDSTSVTCTASGSPGVLDVDPTSVNMGIVDVAMTTPSTTVTLRNTGGSLLTGVYVIFPTTNTADWTVQSGCTMASPCSIPQGSGVGVDVAFHPTARNDRSSSFSVVGGGGGSGSGSATFPVLVTLTGSGAAGELSAAPTLLDFGTIPRSQPFTRTLTISNIGNKPLTANVPNPPAPYSITPTSSQIVSPGIPQDYVVTCQSATASAANNQTLMITSDAHTNPNATIDLKCAIADTMVQVMPQQLDFGEVRVGTPTQMITVTVTNPSSSAIPAHITSMGLREPRTGLTLVPPSTNVTLEPGANTTTVLQLTTSEESDLDGEFFDITVDGTMLSLPVTGKVVTPRSRVAPANLDLGTACVGSEISGGVMLVNDGTATLTAEQPQMDAVFSAASPPGVSYPSTLPPGMQLMATLTPAMSATGELTGTLTWDDDVPSHYQVPVTLDYIDEGTAISPAILDFGTVNIDLEQETPAKHITLENCDPVPSIVSLKSITTKNSPVGAWRIEPRLGYSKMLMPRDKQGVTVRFAPPARGRYEADLQIEANGAVKKIHLIGDATGRDFDNTSFYACACSGGLTPTSGAPILFALIFIARRRRGSSSAR